MLPHRQQPPANPAPTDTSGDGDKENDPHAPSGRIATNTVEPGAGELSPPATSADNARRRPLTQQQTTTEEAADNTRRRGGDGRGGRGAGGVISSVEGERPSTAPLHSDGRVVMRPLGQQRNPGRAGEGGGIEPPSVVFEPGFSRLRTRRVILDR